MIWSACTLCGMAGQAGAQTQSSRSAYFLEGATFRHELNPAFMGERGYVTMPALGNLSLGAQSTAGVGDFLFVKENGDLMTFMHEQVGRDEFLGGLPRRVKFGFNLNETILGFGFYAWGGFNTLGISVKSNTGFSAPDALFRFMKSGVDSPEGSHYRIDDLSLVSTNYAEIALGHAREIDDHWTVGAKAKLLVGLAKATVKIDRLDVTATPDSWQITPSGAQAYLSAKGLVAPTRGETGNYDESDYVMDEAGNRTGQLKPGAENLLSYDDLDFDDNNIGPAGFGVAFDFGATYRLNDEWTFSAAVLDLGFIRWNNTVKATMNSSFEFDGFTEIPINSELGDNDPNSLDNQADRLVDDLEALSKFEKVGEGLGRTEPRRAVHPSGLRPAELRPAVVHPPSGAPLVDGGPRVGQRIPAQVVRGFGQLRPVQLRLHGRTDAQLPSARLQLLHCRRCAAGQVLAQVLRPHQPLPGQLQHGHQLHVRAQAQAQVPVCGGAVAVTSSELKNETS